MKLSLKKLQLTRFLLTATFSATIACVALNARAHAGESLTLLDGDNGVVLEEGLRAERNGKLVRAEALFQQAAIIPETQEQGTVSLARVLATLKRPNDAKKILKDYVTSVNPFSVDAHLALVDLDLTAEQVADADQEIEIVAKLRPGYEPFQERRAILAFKTGDYQKAIVSLSRVLKAKPDSANALRLRIEAYRKTNQIADAAKDQEHLLQLEPALAKNYQLLAQLRQQLRDYDGAISALNIGLNELGPSTHKQIQMRTLAAETLSSIASDLTRMHQFDRAKAAIKVAIKLKAPDRGVQAKVYTVAGELMDAQKHPENALKFYSKATQNDPGTLDAGFRLADLALARGDFRRAADSLLRILSHEPANERAARKLVEVYGKADRRDSLGLFLRNYVDTFPAATWAMIDYVKLLDSIGNRAEARATLARAVENDGSTADTALLYVKLLDRDKKYKDAAQVLTAALARFPEDSRIRFDLGLAYEHADEYAKAEKAYRSVPIEDAELYFQARVNLAFYQERHGDRAKARQTLSALQAKVGESAELTEKISELSGIDRKIASEGDQK